METRAHYVAVGAFVLILMFLAFTAVLWLAGTQFATEYARYDIYFHGPVSGLSKAARVDYNGIPVGRVSDIEIAPDNVEQIRVTVEIEKKVVIKEDAAANVETNLLSGVSYILISRGTQDAKTLVAYEGQRYPVIRSRRSTLASISARGPQLLEKVDTLLDHLDTLLNDENRANFNATLGNLRKFTGNLADRSEDFADAGTNAKDAMAALKTLLTNVDQSYSSPNGLKDQLSVALTEFDKLVKGLGESNRQIELTLQDARPGIRNFSQRTLVDIDSLVGETRQLVSGLSRVAGQLERDPTRIIFGDRREGYSPK
jgi:phospholipid/cholesterol/gamma-HCH transport system substrate-binding protein